MDVKTHTKTLTLRELRMRSGQSPEQIAVALGRSRAWLYLAENGRVSFGLAVLEKLAALYRVPLAEIY